MQRLYRRQAATFDWTRGPILLGRERLAEFVRDGDRVLEVGCGTGRNLPALLRAAGPQGRVVGIECAPVMAARARQRATEATILELDFGGEVIDLEPVDVVVFSYSLSMIPHFAATLAAAARVLREGGRIVVLDFADAALATVRGWMRWFGVSLDEQRWTALTVLGVTERREDFRAWGLWRYRLVVVAVPGATRAVAGSRCRG